MDVFEAVTRENPRSDHRRAGRHEFDIRGGPGLCGIDFARIAEGYGAVGIRVETPWELPEAVARALESSTRSAVILDVFCDHR